MDDQIELIVDGDGLAVIGGPIAVEHFLASEGLQSKDLGLERLQPSCWTAAGLAQAGSEIAAQSGRWMKLTEESAAATVSSMFRREADGDNSPDKAESPALDEH